MTPSKYIQAEQRLLNFMDRSIEPAVEDRGWGALSFGVKNMDPARHAIEAVLSSDAEDRYGEVIDPKGFEPFLDRFHQNPQLLFSHNPTSNIGHWEKMKITKHAFEGWAVFDDGDPAAMVLWRKYERKIMRAFSVGFIAHEWEMEEVGSGKNKARRRRFTLVEALEGSAVTIPANHEALSKAFAAAGAGAGPAQELQGNTPPDVQNLIDAALKRHSDDLLEALSDPDGKFGRALLELHQRARDREGLEGYFELDAPPHERAAGQPARDGAGALFA